MDGEQHTADFHLSPDVPSVNVHDVGNVPSGNVPGVLHVQPHVKKELSEAKLNQLVHARGKAAEARKRRAQEKKDAEFDAMFKERFERYMEATRRPPSPPRHNSSSWLSRSAF